MLSEISTDETRGSIFSYFALTGSLSSLLAPLAGGLLARPADRFPMFRFHLLISYPYLLPSLLAGGLPASAAFLSVTFLRETLPPAASGQPRQSSSIWSLLKAPALAKLLIVHNSYSFVGFSWMASMSRADSGSSGLFEI